ncbi:PKD domain-containing protein [Pseudoduganella sp. UC29_106]|uniref:PKD domain-containing protein n=1 Tax=Pseudoduganella sp. UC29_106 TaxID=3374553 RepID=UPI003756E9DD
MLALVGDSGTPSIGAEVSLTGAGSSDPESGALSYSWTLQSKPAGSNATLPTSNTAALKFTPDLGGNYVVRLRVTDPAGAASEQDLTVAVTNHAPVALLDKKALTVLAGGSVTVSGGLSYDEDGDALSYSWTLDSRPVGSAAVLDKPAAAELAFTPDLPGTYSLLLKVSDGKRPATTRLDVKVLAQLSGSVALPFTPLAARYSKALDKAVMVSSGPDALRIVDPFSGLIKSVVLPGAYKAMSLSADGKLAAVLHEGSVTLVDLQTASVVRTSATNGSQTEVMLTDSGVAYLAGQTGGQWYSPSVSALNTRTGEAIATSNVTGFGYFYGTMHGLYSPVNHKGYAVSEGLSPVDISYFTTDATSNAVTAYGDSPYHGDYPIGSTLFLSPKEDLVFTSAGTYFRTDTLRYAGKLTLTGTIASLSQSDQQETLVIAASLGTYPSYAWTYPSVYKRYTGELMQYAADLGFPVIDGQASYGRHIFHSAGGSHVAVVQTGSAV